MEQTKKEQLWDQETEQNTPVVGYLSINQTLLPISLGHVGVIENYWVCLTWKIKFSSFYFIKQSIPSFLFSETVSPPPEPVLLLTDMWFWLKVSES